MRCAEPLFVLLFFVQFSTERVFDSDDKLLKILQNVTKKSLISNTCREVLIMYTENLGNLSDPWAFQMYDATSKIPVGLMSLNFGELGQYSQCLSTKSHDEFVKGKYCLGLLPYQMEYNQVLKKDVPRFRKSHGSGNNTASIYAKGITWALCLPNKCSDKDAAVIFDQLGFFIIDCQTSEDLKPPITTGAISTMTILSVYAFLLVLSTVLDLYYKKTKTEHCHLIVTAFSAYSNGKILFQMRTSSNELSCLNGIRFWSTICVIICHIYSFYQISPLTNAKSFLESPNNWIILFEGVNLSVDSFLFISGMLVVYSYGIAKTTKKFNIFSFYLHRYLRLTPALVASIFVTAYLLRYMGNGPRWTYLKMYEKQCENYWWTLLLYIQNYYNTSQPCLAQSWYLSVDMQLHIITPLFLITLWKYPKIGVCLTVSGIIAFIVVPFCVTFFFETLIPWGGVEDYVRSQKHIQYFMMYYFITHMRAAPYFIGILTGYVLSKIKLQGKYKQFSFNKLQIVLLWVICAVVGLACFLGAYNYLKSEKFEKWGSSSYLALRRPLWSLCLAWIIFACTDGYGGIINWMLSFPIYQVLSKLSYSVYLIHYQIMLIFLCSLQTGIHFDGLTFAYIFCGVTTLSFGISIIWVLAFESPVPIIEKVIFGTSKNRQE